MSDQERHGIPQADIPPGAMPPGLTFSARKQAAPLLKLINARLHPKPKVQTRTHKPKKKAWQSHVTYY